MTRVAVVSGANRGIGAAIAAGLVDDGWEVWATSRSDSGREGATAIGARWHALDVTDPSSVAALADAVGSVDALINNAGVALDGFDAEVVRATMAVNLHGVMALTEALLPKLAPKARVIMVSSGVGELGGLSSVIRACFEVGSGDRQNLLAHVAEFEQAVAAHQHTEQGWPSSAYKVSKAALNAYTRLLSRELEDDPRGIQVTSMCPGWVATDMGGASAPRSPAQGADTAIWLASEHRPELSGKFLRDRQEIAF